MQTRGQALTIPSRNCERPPINHTCEHVGRDVHQIPTLLCDLGFSIRLISILSLVRRSFLPALRLWQPQVDFRRLECRDLRQSAASRRAAIRSVCINHRFHEPWAHLQPAVRRLPVVRAQLDTRRHDLKTYQIQRSRGHVPSSGIFLRIRAAPTLRAVDRDLAKRLRRGRLRSKDLCVTFGSCKQDCPTGLLRSGISIPVVAVTEITVEPRLIPPAGRGALMGLRSRTRFTKSKRQPKSGPL